MLAVVWLFFINRYLSPFGFIINLFGTYGRNLQYMRALTLCLQHTCPHLGLRRYVLRPLSKYGAQLADDLFP